MEVSRGPKSMGMSRSGFPDGYRNSEGKNPEHYALYEPWEHMSPSRLKSEGHTEATHLKRPVINGGYPTGGHLKPSAAGHAAPLELLEYPVNTKPAGHVAFDYNKRPTPAYTVEAPIHRGDRKDLARRPFNDPGTVRANVSIETGQIVGVAYHPEGNTNGFVRAPMAPLDQATARRMRQHQDMESRPAIRQRGVADRVKVWDPSHPAADWRTMTIPGREQDSEVMGNAIKNYAGGRRPRRWRKGRMEQPRHSVPSAPEQGSAHVQDQPRHS